MKPCEKLWTDNKLSRSQVNEDVEAVQHYKFYTWNKLIGSFNIIKQYVPTVVFRGINKW